jgi:CRISPR-associated protein Csm2
MSFDNIKLEKPTPELFDSIADDVAKRISAGSKNEKGFDNGKNKSTQLRRFYDEVVMWDQRIKTNPGNFDEYLPLIRMINAKVAYAKGRNLVDETYFQLMKCCLGQIKDKDTFTNCKRFLEAFMGFYKMYSPK